MKIYFMRHGQTDWNLTKKLQGRTDVPLNENGRRAALESGARMKDMKFDLCITSPLQRAMETAALVLSQNRQPLPVSDEKGWSAGRQTEMHGVRLLTDERLIEYCFGEWEGKIFKGPGYELPVKEYGDYWEPLSDDVLYPGMEGKAVLVARVRSFLDELTARYKDRDINILVVAHGAVMRAVHVIADDEINTFRINPVKNCEAVILEPDVNASEDQKRAGILPGDLKYGRKLKMFRGEKS